MLSDMQKHKHFETYAEKKKKKASFQNISHNKER